MLEIVALINGKEQARLSIVRKRPTEPLPPGVGHGDYEVRLFTGNEEVGIYPGGTGRVLDYDRSRGLWQLAVEAIYAIKDGTFPG